jgi:hypothetical protein
MAPRSSYASRSYWGAEIRPPGPQAPAGYRGWPRPSLSPSLPSWRGLRCTSFRRWRARLPPTELVGPLGGRTGWPAAALSPFRAAAGPQQSERGVCAPKDRAAERGPLIEDALGTWHPSSGLASLLRQTRHGQSARVDRFCGHYCHGARRLPSVHYVAPPERDVLHSGLRQLHYQ